MKNLIQSVLFIAALFIAVAAQAQSQPTEEVTTIQLVQTPGQFETTELTLAPGDYIFEVTNQGVDHKVAFLLTDGGKKSIKNAGLSKLLKDGETRQTGVVTLTEGTYEYSCPLNPTPQYTLVVKK